MITIIILIMMKMKININIIIKNNNITIIIKYNFINNINKFRIFIFFMFTNLKILFSKSFLISILSLFNFLFYSFFS